MSDGSYSWEQAVLEALRSDRQGVAAKIDLAKRALFARLHDATPPDACETSALLYALEALNALRALADPHSDGDPNG